MQICLDLQIHLHWARRHSHNPTPFISILSNLTLFLIILFDAHYLKVLVFECELLGETCECFEPLTPLLCLVFLFFIKSKDSTIIISLNANFLAYIGC